jgi:CRISPR-associated protein Cas2
MTHAPRDLNNSSGASRRPAPWLIAYDICNPRRLQRVHAFLKKRALRVQHSVYLALLTAAERNALAGSLEAIIDPDSDDVRLYSLAGASEPVWIGANPLPDGVQISDELLAPFLARRDHAQLPLLL